MWSEVCKGNMLGWKCKDAISQVNSFVLLSPFLVAHYKGQFKKQVAELFPVLSQGKDKHGSDIEPHNPSVALNFIMRTMSNKPKAASHKARSAERLLKLETRNENESLTF